MSETEFSRKSCSASFPVTVMHVHPRADRDSGRLEQRPQQDSNLRTRLRRPKCCTEMLTHGNLGG
jgi:hypothetical protein